jgi:hypothetical protein
LRDPLAETQVHLSTAAGHTRVEHQVMHIETVFYGDPAQAIIPHARVRTSAQLTRRGLDERRLHQHDVIGIEHYALGPLAHLDLKLM